MFFKRAPAHECLFQLTSNMFVISGYKYETINEIKR